MARAGRSNIDDLVYVLLSESSMAASSCCHGPYAKGLMLAESTLRRLLASCIDYIAAALIRRRSILTKAALRAILHSLVITRE